MEFWGSKAPDLPIKAISFFRLSEAEPRIGPKFQQRTEILSSAAFWPAKAGQTSSVERAMIHLFTSFESACSSGAELFESGPL